MLDNLISQEYNDSVMKKYLRKRGRTMSNFMRNFNNLTTDFVTGSASGFSF